MRVRTGKEWIGLFRYSQFVNSCLHALNNFLQWLNRFVVFFWWGQEWDVDILYLSAVSPLSCGGYSSPISSMYFVKKCLGSLPCPDLGGFSSPLLNIFIKIGCFLSKGWSLLTQLSHRQFSSLLLLRSLESFLVVWWGGIGVTRGCKASSYFPRCPWWRFCLLPYRKWTVVALFTVL